MRHARLTRAIAHAPRYKAAQPQSSEKNATSRAGQTPCARLAVGICYTRALISVTLENRAFDEKVRLDAVLPSEGTGGACAHACCLLLDRLSRPLDMDRHCADLDPTICGGCRRPRATVDGGRRPRSAKGRDRRRPKAGVGACIASRARARAEEAPIRVRKGPFDPPLCVSPLVCPSDAMLLPSSAIRHSMAPLRPAQAPCRLND